MRPGKDAELLARGFKAMLRLEHGRLVDLVVALETETKLRFYPALEDEEDGLLGARVCLKEAADDF